MITKGLMSSNSDEWGTPKSTFDYLNKIYGFTLDVCASEFNRKLDNYYSIEDNALEQDWNGVVWCNPPYSKGLQTEFIKKAIREVLNNRNCQKIVMLIPARTDTKNFHDLIVGQASEVHFIKGRIEFLKSNGGKSESSPFPSMLVIFQLNTNGQTIFKTRDDLPRKDLFMLDDYKLKNNHKSVKDGNWGLDY